MSIRFEWMKNSRSEDSKMIRTAVFIKEQGVAEYEEFDGSDSYAENTVLYENNIPCATGRITVGERGECMIGRVAVLKEYRGKGLGSILMSELMRRAGEKGFDTVYVHAQLRAKKFYENLGFESYGDIFMEAGIVHISMKKSLY